MDIVNIVASGSFNQPIVFADLVSLGDNIIFSTHEKKRVFIKVNRRLVGIFPSGKYTIKGLKSFEDISSTWDGLLSLLSPYLDTSLFDYPQIQNIVALESLNHHILLNKLFIDLKDENIDYEPEIFPGFIWRTEYGTANIFSSGKVMLLGTRSEEQLRMLWDFLYDKLLQFLE